MDDSLGMSRSERLGDLLDDQQRELGFEALLLGELVGAVSVVVCRPAARRHAAWNCVHEGPP